MEGYGTQSLATGQASLQRTPVTPSVNILLGINRVEEIEKRLTDLLSRVLRLNGVLGGQNVSSINEARGAAVPPRSEVLVNRLLETAQSCHALLSQIDDQGARLEISLTG